MQTRAQRFKAWLGWLLFVLLLLGSVWFIVKRFLPQKRALEDNRGQLAKANARIAELESANLEARDRAASVQRERDQLSSDRERALKEKEAIEKELERLRGSLGESLGGEIEAGDITIRRRGKDLVVDVADKILFDIGRDEISERGKAVLERVNAALASFPKHVIQVGGHTDNTPVVSEEVQERFATNWELSTARATNVVRFLQDTGKLPGERLMAAGFAEYRPAANNASQAGRRKNRRIEIALIAPPSEGP